MAAKPEGIVREKVWKGRLELELGRIGGRTALLSKRHSGPICVQKSFDPGDGSCHVYVLHPPGALAGGDDLAVRANVVDRGDALITMPAATKFYRSSGQRSRLVNRIEVAAGCRLEWLPPETILFGGSRAELATEINLAPGAVFIGWEALMLGRPLSGDHYASGSFLQRFACLVDNRPVLLERLSAEAGDPLLSSPWGLAGHASSATMVAYPAEPALLDVVRRRLLFFERVRLGATIVDDWLVVRMVGPRPSDLRQCLEAARQCVAPALLGRPAVTPRIWHT